MLFKEDLIPAVIQDHKTKEVLMLGYMNQASLAKTLETKLVTFYSRSKKRLWTKGEESKNYLKLVEIKIDCDYDTLLIQATPAGPTCHTGKKTCFFRDLDSFLLRKIYHVYLCLKKNDLATDSTTSKLFQKKDQSFFWKRFKEELQELKDVKSGAHSHTTLEKDLILEGHQTLYWLILFCIQKGDSIEVFLKNDDLDLIKNLVQEEGINFSEILLYDYDEMKKKKYLEKFL